MAGSEEIFSIQCDTFALSGNLLVAVLEWGHGQGLGGMRYAHLRPELLKPSEQPHLTFDYLNHHEPLVIPADLADTPDGLTEHALRRGFFRC